MSASLIDQVKASLIKVFPVDGHTVASIRNYVDKEMLNNQESYSSESIPPEDQEYLKQWKVIIAGFLGLPNKNLKQKSFALNLLWNFIGWNPEHSLARNIVFVLPHILLNTLVTVSRLFNNILKLGTEALPQILSDVIATALQTPPSESLLDKVANYGLKVADILVATWVILGRALTSPATNARLAASVGYKMGEKYGHPKLFTFLGSALATMLTIVLYGAFWPLAAKVLASKVVPVMKEIAPHLPQFIKTAAGFLKTAFEFIKPVMQHISLTLQGEFIGWMRVLVPLLADALKSKPVAPQSTQQITAQLSQALMGGPVTATAPPSKNRSCTDVFTRPFIEAGTTLSKAASGLYHRIAGPAKTAAPITTPTPK